MFLYRDEDLELQLLEPRHAEELFALTDANREHVREWLLWVDQTHTAADTRAFLEGRLRSFAEDESIGALGIRYRSRLVGTIGLVYLDWSMRRTEIGYWLSADAQGSGIMTRACRILVSYAFGELGMNKVEIRCAGGNRKSRAIPQRLGFTQEGVIRQSVWLYDHFEDMVVYGMLADEWSANKIA